jgi:hypothetical protein
MVRAKFRVDAIKQWAYGGKTLELSAVYDDGIEENRRFAKATPSGKMEIQIDNPSAAEFFELGKSYYLDFTKTG